MAGDSSGSRAATPHGLRGSSKVRCGAMTDSDLCFEAVLFDLDGTLVATDRFWPDAARAGALRAFAELGIERAMPSAEEWMGMVGLPLAEGFDAVFADLEPAQRQVVREACVQEEHRLLEEGAAGLLPGTALALDFLMARGVRMGIASNCSQSYLDAMMKGLGLAAWIGEGRCLDSRGIANKADMVEDLLQTFGTRRAVMVGDRAGDRQAAWANGVPHIHLARGYARAGETTAAEATLGGLDELPELLGRRTRAVRECLAGLGLAPQAGWLGVGGLPGAGKSHWTVDLAEELQRQGRALERVDMEHYRRPSAPAWEPGGDPLRAVQEAYDLEKLVERLERPARDPGAVRLVEGRFLLHSRVLQALDRLLWIDTPEEIGVRRIEGRDVRLDGPPARAQLLGWDLPVAQALVRAVPPEGAAHRVESGGNPLALS